MPPQRGRGWTPDLRPHRWLGRGSAVQDAGLRADEPATRGQDRWRDHLHVRPDVESAIAQAKAAAGDKNVHIMGGASTADQALQLGLVDQLNLHIDPVLVGGGTRLFADVGSDLIKLERTRLIEGPRATHVQYRILR